MYTVCEYLILIIICLGDCVGHQLVPRAEGDLAKVFLLHASSAKCNCDLATNGRSGHLGSKPPR